LLIWKEKMSAEYFDSIEFDGLFDNFFSSIDDTTDDDITSTCSSSDSLIKYPELFRKQKKRKYYYVPVIRVLKTDVRRSYADMFGNVWNSVDLPLLFGFLETYCKVNFLQESYMPRGNTDVSSTRNMQGVVSVAKFWYTTMLLSPDLTIKVGETNVIYSPEDKSLNRVEAKFRIRGTRIYDTPDNLYCSLRTIPLTQEEKELYNPNNKRSINEETSRLSVIDNIRNSAESVVRPFGLNPNPICMDAEGMFTFYTDDENRVTRFVLSVSKSSRNCCQSTPGRVLWPGYEGEGN
jgi:hypothetical protein